MSARLKVTLVFAVAVCAAAVVAVTRGGASGDTATLSNHGHTRVAVRHLASAHIRTGSVLAVRGGRAFYRLDRAGDTPCFGVGRSGDVGNPGAVVCPRGGFPASGSPVLDLSVYESTRHDVRDFSLFRVAGFAADGVAAIEFFRPNGSVALTVPVSGNVYATSDVPPGPIAGYAALDAHGERLWRSP
jgi:hypothetical protein